MNDHLFFDFPRNANINKAKKKGVIISVVIERLDEAYNLIRETFKRSKLPFMNFESLKRYMIGLGENGKLMIAEYQGHIQSCGPTLHRSSRSAGKIEAEDQGHVSTLGCYRCF